jgi:hypothetical protein
MSNDGIRGKSPRTSAIVGTSMTSATSAATARKASSCAPASTSATITAAVTSWRASSSAESVPRRRRTDSDAVSSTWVFWRNIPHPATSTPIPSRGP